MKFTLIYLLPDSCNRPWSARSLLRYRKKGYPLWNRVSRIFLSRTPCRPHNYKWTSILGSYHSSSTKCHIQTNNKPISLRLSSLLLTVTFLTMSRVLLPCPVRCIPVCPFVVPTSPSTTTPFQPPVYGNNIQDTLPYLIHFVPFVQILTDQTY